MSAVDLPEGFGEVELPLQGYPPTPAHDPDYGDNCALLVFQIGSCLCGHCGDVLQLTSTGRGVALPHQQGPREPPRSACFLAANVPPFMTGPSVCTLVSSRQCDRPVDNRSGAAAAAPDTGRAADDAA